MLQLDSEVERSAITERAPHVGISPQLQACALQDRELPRHMLPKTRH